jgi:hypothetical protein
VLDVQLRFDPAPNGYGGGNVIVRFENVDSPPSSEDNSGPEPLMMTAGAEDKLTDGKAVYNLKLAIAESMSPGRWKLVQVSLGRSDERKVPFSDDVSFDIPPLRPMVAHVKAPSRVEAGQQFILTVTLDEYPSDIYKECAVSLGVRLRQASSSRSVDLGFQPVTRDHLSYRFSHVFEPDFPSGPWQAEVLNSARPAGRNQVHKLWPLSRRRYLNCLPNTAWMTTHLLKNI